MRAQHLGAILFLSFATSCTASLGVPGAGLAPEHTERVDRARVFLRDGTMLELDHVLITPDSIFGRGGTLLTRLAVARRDVEGVDTRGADSTSTFFLGALAVFAALFLTLRVGGL